MSGWKMNKTITGRHYITSHKITRALRLSFSHTVSVGKYKYVKSGVQWMWTVN